MDEAKERRVNKRRGPDIWVKLIHWFGVGAWVLMAVALILIDKARPQLVTFFDRILNIELRTTWDSNLVRTILFLMVALFCLCFTGILINSKRHRRKDDRYNRSLIIMGILAGFGIIACLIYGDFF